MGTGCPGYELSWVRVVLGTSRPGYELSWVRVVLGTSRHGYELSWVRVVHNPIPRPSALGECPHRGDSSQPPPAKKLQGVHLINECPVNFQNIGTKLQLLYRQASLITLTIYKSKFKSVSKIEIFDSQQNASLTPRKILKGPNVSNFKTLWNFENQPRNAKMSQSNFVSLCGYFWAAMHRDYRDCVNILPIESYS